MKKILAFLAIFLVAIMTVSAQQLTLSDVTIGGGSQGRDTTATATVTVSNTGSSAITGITLALSGVSSVYNASLAQTSIASIAAGATATVSVSAFVPEDQDAGLLQIGSITASGNNGSATVTATSKLNLEAENNLVIKDVNVAVNEDEEDVDDGDNVEVLPYADVTFTIEVKNKDGDFDMEDVEITVIGEGDFDFIDEDDDASTIKDGDTETFDFSFSIDEDADEGDYDVEITLEGTDENGAEHGETWVVTLEYNKEGIIITKAVLSPETLVCGQDSFQLQLTLSNVDSRDEDDAAIEIVAETLDFEKRVSDIEIEGEEDVSRTFTITVPQNAAEGAHVIELTAFKDFDEDTHTKYVYFNVPSGCSEEPQQPADEDDEEADSDIVVNTGDEEQDEDLEFVDVSSGEPATTSKLLDSNVLGTVLLVLANVLLLVIIAVLVVKFLVRN